MPPFPLAARVVEVIADLGEASTPRYRLGSGCIVVGRTVLTAAHVVTGAVGVLVRGPDKVVHSAVTDPVFTGDVNSRGPDLALLEIIDDGVDVPPIGLAAVERDSPAGDPVERCHVIGYPAFMEREAADGSRFRETADALGQVPVLAGLAGGLLSVQVSNAPEPLPPTQVMLRDSPWSGVSGAPVVADGYLLAVVTEHAPRAGPSAITATPVTALEADPAHPGWGQGVANPRAWWARLEASGAKTLKRLPTVRLQDRPTYWATVQEIRTRTRVLTGRQNELAGIASFMAGHEGYRWLVGDAWAGKTSLLAEAATTLPEDVDVVCYFLSRREADADSSGFLAAVVPQLASLLDKDPPTAELHQFRALWQRATERANAEGRPLVLIVDGLDEDLRPPGLPSVAALLPAGVGGCAHVLVSSRPHPELPADVPAGHPLTDAQPTPVQPFAGAQELAVLARQEIDDLLRRDDDGLAADVLGLLTAAAGPLAVRDLAAMTTTASQSPALVQRIRTLVTNSAARSLQTADLAGHDLYQFAHESLLAYTQANDDLSDPDFRHRIYQWAEKWRDAGWPGPAGGEKGTPQYLLDSYPSTLIGDPWRLAQLVSDIGWVERVIASVGIDSVLADIRRAAAANPESTTVAAVTAVATGQAYDLRRPQPVDQPGYILRQLWMQAAELAEAGLAENIRDRLQSRPDMRLIPRWTTRRASRALSGELARHNSGVWAVAVLADGRVVAGTDDGWTLALDPATLGANPAELGRHHDWVRAVAVLADGRVVTGGDDGRVLAWNPAAPGASPAELGRHDGSVYAVAVLADGRVVTGGDDGRVLAWNPAAPGASPAELGRHDGSVYAVAVLADGRVVTGGRDRRVLAWNPAAPDASPAGLGRHNRSVRAVAVLADGRVVTGGDDGQVLAWDPAASGAIPTELGGHDDWVRAMAVLPDGRVVTGGDDGRVLAWDPAAPGTIPTELGSHDDWALAVAVLPDGRVVTGGRDGRVLAWDPAASGSSPAELSRYDWVQAVAVLPDGRVISGRRDGRVLAWDPAVPSASPTELSRQDDAVDAVAVLPDGRVVTGGHDGRLLAWDPNHVGARPVKLGRHHGWVGGIAVLPDGRMVTGGHDGLLLAWDPAAPGARPTKLGRRRGPIWTVVVLPDGRVVTGGQDRWVLAWDPAHVGAKPIKLGRHHGPVYAVAAMADGHVVAGGSDGRVLVWDLAHPGVRRAKLGRHNGWVQAVAVLPGGRVVTGGQDRRVLMWDLARAGTQVVQLSCSVTALATTSLGLDGSNLVIAHEGSGFSFWSFTG